MVWSLASSDSECSPDGSIASDSWSVDVEAMAIVPLTFAAELEPPLTARSKSQVSDGPAELQHASNSTRPRSRSRSRSSGESASADPWLKLHAPKPNSVVLQGTGHWTQILDTLLAHLKSRFPDEPLRAMACESGGGGLCTEGFGYKAKN
jgi:hypothetical protein